MFFDKSICQICHHNMSKSKLKEYTTIEGNKILCCERCSRYVKINKKERNR